MAEGTATQAKQENVTKRGFVKQVLSGDSVVLQLPTALGSPPSELTVYLANVGAPRLARRPTENTEAGTDEPYAWEAREFLRKKIVGQTVTFVREFLAISGREHGRIYVGGTSIETAENVSEAGVSAGLLEVRPGKQTDETAKKLLELQEQAKSAKKGRWSDDEPSKHVRSIQWNIEDPRSLVNKYSGKQVDAVVEHVRDGSTIRAFLLPAFEHVTIQFSGVKAPAVKFSPDGKSEDYGEEAKFFVEIRLLQRDVKVVLESVSNQNIIGSVLHPRGNIAEFLLREGLAKCVDWTMGMVTGGADKLREAERFAKEKRLRLFKSFTGPTIAAPKKGFSAKVVEIGLGDSLSVLKDNGEEMKIYFSSLRPPRREAGDGVGPTAGGGGARQFRPLYDIPFMFECREYLRKRLLDKRVTVIVDYVQPKEDKFPEKSCCTVLSNNQNMAFQLIERGLAKALRHRQEDNNRSSQYDQLISAEAQAEQAKKGMWAEKSSSSAPAEQQTPQTQRTLRIQELQGDAQRSKQFLPYLQRSGRSDGIVEFVTSASRLRVYVPKESCIITFLLSGINAPRTARFGQDGKQMGKDEPYAEEALKFTRYKALQRDVQIEVETTDKAGGFIGYLFIQTEKGVWKNLSEQLVENGLASVHFTAERSPYYNQLVAAEEHAKTAKLGIWKNFVGQENVDEEKQKQADDTTERKMNYKKVVATEIYNGNRFAVQSFDDGQAIEKLMNTLQIEMKGQPAAPFVPKRQQLCAAMFENLWNRARVEGVKGDKVDVLYIDFGNRETLPLSRVAPLPAHLQSQPAYAKEYQLALVAVPPDPDYAEDVKRAMEGICFSKPHLLLNVEYKIGPIDAVTLCSEEQNGHKLDVAKQLLLEGYALVDPRRETRLRPLLNEYTEAEQKARKEHLNIWRYGDITGYEL